MGMFDSVMFTCPHCGKSTEVQSKDGRCILARYSQNGVPLVIAAGLEGSKEYCHECKKSFFIRTPSAPQIVAMGAYVKDPLNNDPDDEY